MCGGAAKLLGALDWESGLGPITGSAADRLRNLGQVTFPAQCLSFPSHLLSCVLSLKALWGQALSQGWS